jgi:outer membrane autotransporter protein
VFIQGDLDIGNANGTPTQNGFDIHTKGLTLGGDRRFAGNDVLGAAFGFVWADADLDNNAGSQNAKGWSISLYGEYVPVQDAYIDLAVTYGQNKYDGVRRDTTSTSLFEYNSSPHGDQFGAALSAGYQFYYEAVTLIPYGRVEYVDVSIDAFQESSSNGGPTPLSVSKQRYKSTVLTGGGQVQYAWSQSWGVLVPYARVEFQYAVQQSADAITAQYVTVGVGPGAQPISIPGTDKSYGSFSVGATAVTGHGFSGYFNFQRLFGKENFSDNRYTLGIRYDF